MFRSGASRSILRSLNTSQPALRTVNSPLRQQLRSQLCTISRRPQLASIAKPLAPQTLALARWQTSGGRGPMDTIDTKREEKIQSKVLPETPETVSATSSMTPVGAQSSAVQEPDVDMMAGIRSDLETIRETFSLQDVPKQAYYMGLAGVLPYMATSFATIFCAWDINHAAHTGNGFLLDEKTAELMLHIIEPIQVGYGAVILSFLGAIHWGLEWAEYGGSQGYPRYMIGVLSTAVAWPTILLPVEYALITQFLAFNFLYYTDVRAKTRGWAPPWYGIYRFVLTFIVGGSIVLSLVGRGQISDRIGHMPSSMDRIRMFKESEFHEDGTTEEEIEARRKYLGVEEGDEDSEEGEDEE